MFCTQCGKQIPDDAIFCNSCGNKIILNKTGAVIYGTDENTKAGLVYLNKKESVQNSRYDIRSGKGGASVVPEEIKKWHWGAFTLHWIWGLWNHVWISLLVLVPLLNLVILVMLGIKGNEWAWRKKRWESVEQFQRVQRKWSMWGIGILIFNITVSITAILLTNLVASLSN